MAVVAGGATPDRRIGLVYATVLSLLVSVAVIEPFGGRGAGTEPSFAVAVVAIVGCFDLMSAVLLARQFRDTGDRRALTLSSAYVFALVVLAGYAAAFPGIIGTRPPLGSDPSTAPWLWVAWHVGFPVLLAAALAPWPHRWDAAVRSSVALGWPDALSPGACLSGSPWSPQWSREVGTSQR